MAIIGTPTIGAIDAQAAASTTSLPGYPTGTAAGDLLVLFGVSGAASGTTFTSTPPTGFTTRAAFSSAGTTLAPNIYCGTKVAVGGETGTLSCTHGNVVTTMAMVRVPGVDPSTILDVAVVQLDDTTVQTSFTFPAQSVATDGALALYCVSGNATTLTATPATGFTELADRTVASSRSYEIAYKPNLPVGTTGSISAAPGWSATSKVVGVLLILRPAQLPDIVQPPRR